MHICTFDVWRQKDYAKDVQKNPGEPGGEAEAELALG
jgi:hypothetical protein